AVEEEQLVVATGTAHRAADRVAPRAVLAHGLRFAVLLARPRVAVPVRVVLDVVDRPVEAVGAALGHGRDLQARRPAVLGLVALRQHLDLGNRLDVHLQHLAVVARVHGRDAVHHDVVLARAADAGPVLAGTAAHARNERDERGEVAVATHRQAFDLRRGHRERAFTALRLDDGRLGRHFNGFLRAAWFDDQG